MNRLCMGALVLALAPALAPAACTADFFVGPLEGSSSTAEAPDDSDPSSVTSASLSTTGSGSSTTQTPTTQPELTTSSTSDPSTTTAAETGDNTGLSTESTSGAGTGDTEAPADCVPKQAPACEEAFPACLWNGEECTVNPCNVGGQKACLTEAPECIWEAGGCIPSGCNEEVECSVLAPGPCEIAEGCILIGATCFTPLCVPCLEVKDIVTCDELPSCAYNEGREACLPQ